MKVRAWRATVVILLAVIALLPVQMSIADDPFPPEVGRIDPSDGAKFEPGRVDIEVNFTEAMNLTAMESALVVDPHVDYVLRFWTVDNTTFFYRMTLDPGTYHFSLADTIEDVNGTRMASPVSWSYEVGEDESRGVGLPRWVGYVPGTFPVVLMLAIWYVYENKKKMKLPPKYQKRMEELQPKTFDLYTIAMLAVFASVLILIGLYFIVEWFFLLMIAGPLALVVGFMALVGFILGVGSASSARSQVEMETYGYQPTVPQVDRETERLLSVKTWLIVIIGILAYFAFLAMLPMPGGSFDPYPLLFFVLAFIVLIALLYYVSKLVNQDRSSESDES